MATPYNAYQSAVALVSEKFETSQANAEAALAQTNDLLAQLLTMAGALVPQRADVTIKDTTLNNLDAFVPDKPDDLDLDTSGFDSIEPPPPYDGKPLDTSDLAQYIPNMSGLITPGYDIDAAQLPYVSSLLTALQAKLLDGVLNGGTGLSDDVKNDIWDLQSEQDLLALQQAQDRIAAEWSKRGLPLPDGTLATLLNEPEVAYFQKRSDASRQIAIKDAELAQTNTHFMITSGTNLEQLLMNLANSFRQRLFDASKAEADASVALFTATLKKYETMASIYNTMVSARVAEVKGLVDVYISEVQAYKATVEAIAAKVDVQVKGYAAEVDRYKADATIYAALGDVETKIFEARIKEAEGKARLLLSDAEMEIKSYEFTKNLTIEAIKAAAQIAAHLCAGMMAGVSAGASIGASGSTTSTENLTTSYEHTYKEK